MNSVKSGNNSRRWRRQRLHALATARTSIRTQQQALGKYNAKATAPQWSVSDQTRQPQRLLAYHMSTALHLSTSQIRTNAVFSQARTRSTASQFSASKTRLLSLRLLHSTNPPERANFHSQLWGLSPWGLLSAIPTRLKLSTTYLYGANALILLAYKYDSFDNHIVCHALQSRVFTRCVCQMLHIVHVCLRYHLNNAIDIFLRSRGYVGIFSICDSIEEISPLSPQLSPLRDH